jgi:hypothetical protein
MKNEFLATLNYSESNESIDSSSILSIEKKFYKTFVNNFPSILTYKNTEKAIETLESKFEIAIPEYLVGFLTTLSGFLAAQDSEFKFSSFIGKTPIDDRLSTSWYSISFSSFSFRGDNRKIMLESSKDFALFPIATVKGFSDASNYFLGINLSKNDKKIYQFNILDLYDNYSSDEPIEQSAYPIFDSYPQMLAHISEIKYMDDKKEIIVKARES